MKNHLTISLAIGIALSVTALYFAFRNIPLDELWHYLRSINYLWTFPAVVLVLVSFFLRALRWQFILASSRKINLWRAFHPLMIGFMINCILPGRLGEFARPAILQKNEKVPFGTGIATVAAERAFDVAALIIFAVVTFMTVEINPEAEIVFGGFRLNRSTLETLFHRSIILGIILITAIVIVSIPIVRRGIHWVVLKAPSLAFFAGESLKAKIADKAARPLIRIVDNIASGFTLLKYPKKIIICALYSCLIWASAVLSWYVFSLGSPGIHLSYAEMYAVMVIICLFIVLPSVPGFWGLWEAGGVFALSLFGISTPTAAGFTLANHAIQMFPVIIVGFISAIITSVNIWQVSYEKKQPNWQTG